MTQFLQWHNKRCLRRIATKCNMCNLLQYWFEQINYKKTSLRQLRKSEYGLSFKVYWKIITNFLSIIIVQWLSVKRYTGRNVVYCTIVSVYLCMLKMSIIIHHKICMSKVACELRPEDTGTIRPHSSKHFWSSSWGTWAIQALPDTWKLELIERTVFSF